MNGASVFLIAFFTSVACATGTVYAIERFNLLHKPVAAADALVPDLRGVPEADARTNANVAHLAFLVASREPSTEVKGGSVLRQSMPAGQHVPRDYPLTVVLAEEVPRVPTVVGASIGEATQRIEQKGFHFLLGATVPSTDAGAGIVIDQSPKGDTPQTKGSTVTVQVSSGAGDVEMPKVIGIGVTQAKTDLEKLGLNVTIRWVALAETPTYVVLNQKPAPKEKVKPGGDVILTACR